MSEVFLDGKITLLGGDCIDVLKTLAENSVDSIVTDPPYGLEFMGRDWDAPWQVSSSSKLFGKRATKMPGWGVTRNPNCRACGGRLRGAKTCSCETPSWDESPNDTRLRQMSAFQEWCQGWAEEALRVLKPGGHLLAFGGTRTSHRLVCAIEDAGFEIRDTLMWVYGSGFNKQGYVSYKLEATLCEQRNGESYYVGTDEKMRRAPPFKHPNADAIWGTAGGLKPALEPICLARKPLSEPTVAGNAVRWGTGALNIRACRVGDEERTYDLKGGQNLNALARPSGADAEDARGLGAYGVGAKQVSIGKTTASGRWPANVITDGSPQAIAGFPETGVSSGGRIGNAGGGDVPNLPTGKFSKGDPGFGDSGSAARYFYCAKANEADRAGSSHPTIKPQALLRYLCRLVTPPGGTVLDMFAGTGSTGEAAYREGFAAILVERELEYQEDIRRRMKLVLSGPAERRHATQKAKAKGKVDDAGPLFAGGVA